MIIERTIKTEKYISKVDFEAKITVEVDVRASKEEIKQEFEELTGEKVKSINTYITPKGKKRAIIKLENAEKAEEVALKLKVA